MTINKIINPCKCKVYTTTGNKVSKNAFAKIEYDGKCLSISGVIAPLANGNCLVLLASVLMKLEKAFQLMNGPPKCLKSFVISGISGI